MRRGVCFDLDGTLLVPHRDRPGWVAATATAARGRHRARPSA